MDRFKVLYDSMLESGDLSEVFPSMSGEWEKDKKKFIYEQTELEKLINLQSIDLDDDID